MNTTFTVDEIVATLKRSSLPTILVEGKDDMIVYRQMERFFGTTKVNFMPCGGRGTLLKVFERRGEFSNIITFFIADKDMWVFETTPIEYNEVLFTTGYSLENDLYMDGKYLLDGLLDTNELVTKSDILKNIVEWYAFETEAYFNGNAPEFAKISFLNENIMAKNSAKFTTDFLKKCNFKKPNERLYHDILENYDIKLRGKFIFQIYIKIFLHFRKINNNDAIVFSDTQLYELCYREGVKTSNQNTCMQRIMSAIKQHFPIKD